MDVSQTIKEILRVNHAGELGARQIYRAQMRILGKTPELSHMATQEMEHLKTFEQLLIEYKVRPTLVQPLWHILSYGLGAATALLGEKSAHACTDAVEEVIVEHYQEQINTLGDDHPLTPTLRKIQAEEASHQHMAIESGSKDAKHYHTLTRVIKGITKLAINISKKI